jgi:hypothetical protein
MKIRISRSKILNQYNIIININIMIFIINKYILFIFKIIFIEELNINIRMIKIQSFRSYIISIINIYIDQFFYIYKII